MCTRSPIRWAQLNNGTHSMQLGKLGKLKLWMGPAIMCIVLWFSKSVDTPNQQYWAHNAIDCYSIFPHTWDECSGGARAERREMVIILRICHICLWNNCQTIVERRGVWHKFLQKLCYYSLQLDLIAFCPKWRRKMHIRGSEARCKQLMRSRIKKKSALERRIRRGARNNGLEKERKSKESIDRNRETVSRHTHTQNS